jgi:hypothetical protein
MASTDDPQPANRKWLGAYRPPVDAPDEELDAWASEVVDAMLTRAGFTLPNEDAAEFDQVGWPVEDSGDAAPTLDMIDQAKFFGVKFDGDEDYWEDEDVDG